jgi:hypothetical protein
MYEYLGSYANYSPLRSGWGIRPGQAFHNEEDERWELETHLLVKPG